MNKMSTSTILVTATVVAVGFLAYFAYCRRRPKFLSIPELSSDIVLSWVDSIINSIPTHLGNEFVVQILPTELTNKLYSTNLSDVYSVIFKSKANDKIIRFINYKTSKISDELSDLLLGQVIEIPVER